MILKKGLVLQLFLYVCVGFFIGSKSVNSQEEDSLMIEGLRFKTALKLLESVPSGKKLIDQMKYKTNRQLSSGVAFSSFFQWGQTSRTNAVLTRFYNPETGKEYRERQLSIYIKKKQSLVDLVLDLAHELTHATERPEWDPYDPELTLGKYIGSSIEGKGGEVDAVVMECKVASELRSQYAVLIPRCDRYRFHARKTITQDFYRVGIWKESLVKILGAEAGRFPVLSSLAPALVSSTGDAPYPVALMAEFQEITQIACKNSKDRLIRLSAHQKEQKNLIQSFLSGRCNGAKKSEGSNLGTM